jgi:hypothetical protein
MTPGSLPSMEDESLTVFPVPFFDNENGAVGHSRSLSFDISFQSRLHFEKKPFFFKAPSSDWSEGAPRMYPSPPPECPTIDPAPLLTQPNTDQNLT